MAAPPIDARAISAALQMAQPRERSYLLAQVLQQMNQPRPNPQSYGSLAAQLGAQFLDKGTADREMQAQQQAQQGQSQHLAQALQGYQQQAQGGMQTLPGTGVQLGDVNSPVGGSPADPEGARSSLLGSLVQNQHPMAQQLASQLMGQMMAPPPESKYIDAGDKLIETVNGKPTGNILPKNPTPDATMREKGDDRRFLMGEDNEMYRHENSQAGMDRRFYAGEDRADARATEVEKNRQVKATASLRKEHEGLDSTKRYQRVLPTVTAVANAPDTPAGDLAVVYGAAKVLDPESAVKEGEFETVLKSKSPMETVLGNVRFATNGKGRLTPESRRQVVEMLSGQVQQYKAAYDRDYERYAGYARDQGVDAEKVVGTRFDAAFTNKSVPKIQSEAEYAKLPSGSTYIDPTGKKRIKK
jgi:hypothetical protein